MKLLVLATNYPDNYGEISLNYIHVRNLYYKRSGHDVVVLNFRAEGDYIKDGIVVVTPKLYWEKYASTDFDLLICHAANIRFHYRFLRKEGKRFKHIVFFYHGHEVMRLNDYPKDYSYVKNKRKEFKAFVSLYDTLKLYLWRKYLTRNIEKVELVFVSEWMRDTFLKNVCISKDVLEHKQLHIIYNAISSKYENESWSCDNEKKYDFITIRGNIDTSKFAIDLVNQLAFNNPGSKFLIVGKGAFFEYYEKAPNVEILNKYLNQDEIADLLDDSRCALMPTRLDAQGVMACEMATYGIPVITSDIPVCRYVLDGFQNVAYISNDDNSVNLDSLVSQLKPSKEKVTRFFERETVQKEIELFSSILNKK